MGSNVINNLKNIPGWRTKKKIVTIECDDWGSIRMPSKKVYNILSAKGLKVDGWFNRYDTLETKEDLEQLFDTLSMVRDKNNKPAIITAVSNMANPDFDKIRSSGFSEYHYEPFTETLKRYYPETDVFKLWREGIKNGVFLPELHGREHITVQIWMEKLREGNRDLRLAFDYGYVFLALPYMTGPAKEFGTEFFFTSDNHKPFLVNSITEGVVMFREIFGLLPRVFVPGNCLFHPEFDRVIAERGIKFMFVSPSMKYPVNGGGLKHRYFIPGQKGPGGLTYYTRNCSFEPANDSYKGIEPTLKQVDAAFRWGKPAMISTHRVNFAGGIDPGNRNRGLTELKKLLKAIVQKWPEAEFMNSGDALTFMRDSN